MGAEGEAGTIDAQVIVTVDSETSQSFLSGNTGWEWDSYEASVLFMDSNVSS